MKRVNSALENLRQAINDYVSQKSDPERKKQSRPPFPYIRLSEFRVKYPYIGKSTMIQYCLHDDRFKELVWRKAERTAWWVDEIGCVEILRENPRFDKYFQLFHTHAYVPQKNGDE